ncbi:Trypanosome variant surface glycoprotein (A-type), putative [Trypanosoma equiperdum]|uniref:Trypanosome variant surface glycoprotein (A-type), putative n=2 Tax=Trypanozoon TaxID=39700 RepID=A0A1G4HY34_TRYEQ|nr:Trypanosome variant surface glycoprotein (A-type), putative [Trypanosoma equiperdum]
MQYYAAKAAQSITDLLERATDKMCNAIQKTATAAAATSAFITQLAETHGASSKGCLVTSENDGISDVQGANTLSGSGLKCKLPTGELKADTDSQHLDNNGFIKRQSSEQTVNTITAGSDFCVYPSQKSTNNLINQGTGQNLQGGPEYVAGFYNLQNGGLSLVATKTLTSGSTAPRVLHEAHKAYLELRDEPATFAFHTVATLAEDPTFQAIYTAVTQVATDNGETNKKPINNEIAQFSGEEAAFLTEFTTKPESETIPKGTAGLNQETTLGNLQPGEEAKRLLEHYQQLNFGTLNSKLKSLQDATTKQDPKAADICNKITD